MNNALSILSIGKTCSVRVLQWINNPKESQSNHQGGTEAIIVLFLRVAYPLKYPSNACLIYLDDG